MALPLEAVVLLSNFILLAAGLLVFLPDYAERPRVKDLKRLQDKFGRYFIAAFLVLAAHLLVLQIDGPLTRWLGWDFAPALEAVENGAVAAIASVSSRTLAYVASVVYVIVHPFMLYFTPLLFILSEEERAAKASLLLFPLAYAMALPFLLFFPATNVFTYFDLAPPVAGVFPELWAAYQNLTNVHNGFPSLQVAFALLVANATRYSRNVRFRYFAFAYAAAVVLSDVYLGLDWLLAVAGGAVIAGFGATLTTRILSVERLALQRVKPEPEEAQAVVMAADDLVETVRERAYELGHSDVDPMLVGSVAKDTYLAHKVDFDVFMLFPPDVPREDLERRGLEIARAVVPDGEAAYAEHPYISGKWQRFDADIVPAYAVDDPAKKMSAVDRTPFHTRFVQERMSREQRDQVRLLKQFMIGVGVYGAEAKTRGFSGYLAELLVLKYRSFRGVVRGAAKWKPGTFLSLETHEGNPKFTDPLVFLDPVDPKRNVASAVSDETLDTFVEACKAFLHREGLAYFFPRQLLPLPPEDLERLVRRRRGDFVLVSFRKPDVLEDHLYDQLRKAVRVMSSALARHEFEVKRATTDIGREHARILLELARIRLPEGIIHAGPPLKEKDHAERFRKTWAGNPESLSDVFVEEGRVKVKRRREFRRAEDLLSAKLPTLDLGKHVSRAIRDGYTLVSGMDVVREETTPILTKHFNRKKPWEL